MLKPIPSKPGLFSVAFKRFSRLRGIAVVTLMTLTLSVLYLSLVTPSTVLATPNATLNFQARLESSSGAIAPDGTYNVEFKLYSASSGGSAEWTEDYLYNSGPGSTDVRVHVANGYLTANLGSITAFPNTINWGTPQYLTMNIGSTTSCSPFSSCSPDGEMSPRLPLTAVPAAFSLESNINASGYNSNLTLTQPGSGVTTGNENFVVQDQGAAGTYSLLTGGSTLSTATAGVVLQSGSPGTVQTGNFNISATGLLATLDATGAGSANTLTIGAGATYTGSIAIDTSASVTTGTVTIGGANQTGTITVGQSTASNTINVGAVAGNTFTQTINIGTSSTAGSKTAVTVGSTVGASTTTVQGGTGGLWLQTGNVSSGLSGNIVIQSGSSTSGTAGNVSIDTGSGAVATGTTLENDTFESGTNGWINWFNSSVAQSATFAHSPTHSLAITDTVSGGGNWGVQNFTTANTVTPGQVYSFSAWVRSTVAEQINMVANWNGSGTSSTVGVVTDTTTGWTKISGNATAPAGATSVWLAVLTGNNYPQNSITYLDDVLLTGGTSTPDVSIGATNAASVTIGNSAEVGVTTLQGGAGGVSILSGSTSSVNLQSGVTSETISNGGDTIATSTNSATAFQIQNAGGANVVNVNTANGGSLTVTSNPNQPTQIQETDAHGTNQTTTTFTTTPTKGDLELLAVSINSSSSATVQSISGGDVSLWEKVTSYVSSGAGVRTELWEGVVANTFGGNTITVTYSATPGVTTELAASEFSAIPGTSTTNWQVMSANTADNASSTAVNFPSATSTGLAGEMYWGYMWAAAHGVAGSTTGFAYHVTGNNNVIAYNPALAASTPYAPTATESIAGASTGIGAIIYDNVNTALTVSGSSSLNGSLTITSDYVPLALNVNNAADENGIYFNSAGPYSGAAGAELGVAGSAGQITNDTNANDLVLKNGNTSGSIRFNTGGSTTSQFVLSNGGAATFQNSTNSATAFQVQNASSSQILNLNTVQSSLVTNPNFEMGTTYWSGVNTGVLSQNTTSSNVYYGNDSLAIALGATANSGATTSTYTSTLTAGIYSLSFMAKASAALTGLAVSLGSGTCTLSTTTVSTTYAFYYCTATTTGSPVVKITATTTSQTLYLDGVELDGPGVSVPVPFRPGSSSIEGSLVVNGNQLQAANSQFALTVNELTDGQAGGGGGLFIQGNSGDLYQNALVVANSVGTDLLTVNDTVNATTINGGSSFWNTAALAVNTIDSGATALSVSGASSGQTANIVQVTGNGLTTGSAVNISSTSAVQTSGSLLNISDTATLATNASSMSGSLVNVSRSLTANITGGTGAPTLDTAGTGAETISEGYTNSWTINYTVSSTHTNRFLIVELEDADSPCGIAGETVAYNGVSMTEIGCTTDPGNSQAFYMFGLANPSSGSSYAISISTNALTNMMVNVSDWYNVNQTTPYPTSGGGVYSSNKAGTSTASLSASSASGQTIVDGLMAESTVASVTPSTTASGQTRISNLDDSTSNQLDSAQSYIAAGGGSTTTMGWSGLPTTGGGYDWVEASIGLNGITGGSETVSSSVASIGNNCTTTSGTCIDGSNVLQLSQSYSGSTGAVLNIQNAGTGNMINATGSNTSFQIQPNGMLVISNSQSSPTTAIRLRAISSGDNIETAGEDMWLSGWTNANFTGTQLYFARGDLPTGDLFIGNAALDGTSNANSNYGVTLLVLDASPSTGSYTGDPSTAFNGSMYYNTETNEFRCYQNSEWRNCVNAVQSWGVGGLALSTGNATAPGSFGTYGNQNNSITFTKAAGTTKLVVHIDMNPWVTGNNAAQLGMGVNITNVTGTSYNTTTTCGQYYFNAPAVVVGGTTYFIGAQHLTQSCSVVVTGAPAEELKATIDWEKVSGTGTLNADSSTWGDMTVQETD